MGKKVETGSTVKYEWMSYDQTLEKVKTLAAAMMKLDLVPEVDGEFSPTGKKWRFLGIQSQNRHEWYLFHLANMYAGTTTVGLYCDSFGDDFKYCLQ